LATPNAASAPAGDSPTAVIVLAAGAGTRMKSALPKVLHPVCGRSMLAHALHAAAGTGAERLVVVVGHQRERVSEAVAAEAEHLGVPVDTAIQHEQNGTGDAVRAGLEALPADFHGSVVVTTSDVPLLDADTLNELLTLHRAEPPAAVTVLTSTAPDPAGYGRIVRDADGGVLRIVEHKDASETELAIDEVNSGVYAFEADLLRSALGRLGTDNSQGELYLTDVIEIANSDGRLVRGHKVADAALVAGANDRVQLAELGRELNRRVCERWMRAGASIVDPATTWIDVTCELRGQDVTLLPGVQLHGSTSIAGDAVVGPDTTLRDTEVREGAVVERAHALSAVIGKEAHVGPFAYLRPAAELGEGSKVGTFVEIKKSHVGDHSKVPHLTYVGDATIGEHSNIGASSVFVNYDGVNKHRTVIGSHVRTGSDTMFIAPVTVGDGAYSGAGTVIKDDVPPGALAVSGGRQRNIEGWVTSRRPGTAAAEAAEKAQVETENKDGSGQ